MKAGWETKALGEVASVSAGNSAPQDDVLFIDGDIPFFRTSDAGKVRFGDIFEAADYLNSQGAKGLKRFPIGTILFPKSGASTFLNHRVMLAVEGCVSSHLATIVANECVVDKRFLLFFLSTIEAQSLIQDHAYPSLNLPVIGGLSIPFPPLPEQHRIVAILDKAFDGIAKAKAAALANLANARAVLESHLQEVFTRYGDGWVVTTLDKASEIVNGFAFKSEDFSPLETVKCIKITNVGVKTFVTESDSYLPTRFMSQQKAVSVDAGNIVIALTRSIISAGLKIAIVPKDYDGALVNQRVAAIKPHPNVALPVFLFSYLSTQAVVDYVKARVNTLMQPNLSIVDLRSMPIPLPSLAIQKEICGKLNQLNAQTQHLESLYQRKTAALDELKKSLLHQAFSGAL